MNREAEDSDTVGGFASAGSTCRFCAACCVNVGRPPFQPEEIPGLPPEVRQMVAWFDRRDSQRTTYVTPCYFLNLATRRCLIYEHRPRACREFRPDGPVCRELRRAYVPCLNAFNADLEARH